MNGGARDGVGCADLFGPTVVRDRECDPAIRRAVAVISLLDVFKAEFELVPSMGPSQTVREAGNRAFDGVCILNPGVCSKCSAPKGGGEADSSSTRTSKSQR